MKKMNEKKKYLLSTVLATSLLFGSIIPVKAEIKLGELGEEANQIAAPVAGVSYSSDVVALDDLGISVAPSDYVAIQQVDGFVYIYTQETDCIPYVIVGYYDMVAEDFASQFTQYMTESYEDLQVMSPEAAVTVGDREYTYIQYSYSVSGYTVRDSRLFLPENGRTYMFGAKEIPELSLYVGSNLEEVAGSFAYLAGGDSDYAKHVDSTRSVVPDAQATVDNIEDTVGDIVEEQGSGDSNIAGGTVGDNSGTAGGSAGGTTSGTEDSDVSDSSAGYSSITFSQDKANYEGTWVPFEDGFQLYLPSAWNTYELTEDQVNQGVLYLAGDASGADTAPAVSVVWAYSDGAETINDLATAIRQGGYQVDDLVSINGIPCVSYRLEDGDCSAIMFFHPTNKDYVFCVTATQYTANVDMICSILTSLSLAL
ncbi:hypothetical protein ACTQ50_02045 [Blautia sp. Sow4_E7]|uniref:hypothetical protein n=1 Tax=Blautia sp. Sow4_E7 TaxID=3438749 RepID=UPI003F92B983